MPFPLTCRSAEIRIRRTRVYMVARQALLESLQKYLEANPDKQVEALDVTASQAGALLEALKSARAVAGGNSASSAARINGS